MGGDSDVKVLSLSAGATLMDLGTEINRLPADQARRAAMFAVRVPEAFMQAAQDFERAEYRRMVLRRAAGRPVHLVTFLEQSRIIEVRELHERGPDERTGDADLLTRIRHADLDAVLRSAPRSAFLRSSGKHHFLAPSLKHTNSFLRVGDLIVSSEALETLSFWCLPSVAASDVIVLDTWSIAAVAFRAMQVLDRQIPLGCMKTHPSHDREGARGLLIGTLRGLEPDGAALFLLSVIGDGEAARTTRALLDEAGYADMDARWVALYAYANSPATVDPLCRLVESYETFESTRDCKWCEAKSQPVPVDPSGYHLGVGGQKDVVLYKKFFDFSRPFVEEYSATDGVLALHRDDPNDGRHHGFYVDALALLRNDGFRSRLEEMLRAYAPKPDVIATPEHPAGRALAEIAAELLEAPAVVHNDLRRERMDEATARLLDQSARILVVDDVIKTGSRLEEFTRALREEYSRFESVDYLIAIARPESEQDLKRVETALTKHHSWEVSFQYLARVLLPGWDAEHCPWCKEYDALARLAEPLPEVPEWLLGRLARLSERGRGICTEPFLVGPDRHSSPLGQESPVAIAGLSPVGTLFMCAGALQAIRTTESETQRLESTYPVFHVFAERNFHNYSESLLRNCLIRLLKPEEWPEEIYTEPGRFVRRCLQAESLCLGEILLAMSRGGLMPLIDEKTIELSRKVFGLGDHDLALMLGRSLVM